MQTRCPLFQSSDYGIEAGPPRSEEDRNERKKAEALLREAWPGNVVELAEGISLLPADEKKRIEGIRVEKWGEGYKTIADLLDESRADPVSQFASCMKRGTASGESPADFSDPRWRRSFEALFWLGYRRRRMFRKATAERTYDIGLDPAYVGAEGDPGLAYVLIPIATLYRKHSRYFRKLLTISIFLIRVEPDYRQERPITTAQIRHTLKGNLKLTSDAWSGSLSVFEIARHYLRLLAGSVLSKGRDSLPAEIEFEIEQGCDPITTGATLKMAAMEAPLGLAQIKSWNQGGRDDAVERLAMELMRRDDVLVEHEDVREHALSGSSLGSRNYVGVFDAGDSFLFALSPRDDMPAPGFLSSWCMLHIRALSTLREMIWMFYQEIATTPDRTLLSHVTMEFVDDFEQFYGLDWRNRYHEGEFQRLKKLDGTEAKYTSLRDKLTSLREHLNVEATFNLTYIVLVASIIGLIVTVYSSLFQGGSAWKKGGATTGAIVLFALLLELFAPGTLSSGWDLLKDRWKLLKDRWELLKDQWPD